MNKRGITSFAQDRENCAVAAALARLFCCALPLPWRLKRACEFLIFHHFLHPVRCRLEAGFKPSLWGLSVCFCRVMRHEFWRYYRLYRAVEGDICVLNGQKMAQVFMLAGAKAKGFKTHARQTHLFNSTPRYNFDFVDCYEVYTQEQAQIVGKAAKLITLPQALARKEKTIILFASQSVALERSILIDYIKNFQYQKGEQLVVRFHPFEQDFEKQMWRDALQHLPVTFSDPAAQLNLAQIKLCVSLNSSLTIIMKKAKITTLNLVKCV